VPRIVYLTSALRDLAKIANDFATASQSLEVALTFTEKLTDYCEHLAELPGLLGRARHELRPEYRSVAYGSYVIFFRHVDAEAPREIMEIIHVVHGARDMEAFFHSTFGDD
jgi:toxin ParE1/3/4